LLSAHEVLATVPAGTAFRWSGGIYLKGGLLVQLDVPPPLVQFRSPDARTSVLVTEKVADREQNGRPIELIVFDVERAQVLMRVGAPAPALS